jgi:hypothetical protein
MVRTAEITDMTSLFSSATQIGLFNQRRSALVLERSHRPLQSSRHYDGVGNVRP